VTHDDVYNIDHAYYRITKQKVEFTIHTAQRSIVSHKISCFIFCLVFYLS